MASTTDYLHLKLLGTSREDKNQFFEDWRQELNGETGESNMELIDAAYHEMDEALQDISENVDTLMDALEGMITATTGDVGKALLVKTVENGEVTEWEFGDTATVDATLTHSGEAADAKVTGDRIGDMIIVSDEEPQTEDTKLWIDEDSEDEVLIPGYAEFALQSETIPDTVQSIVFSESGNVSTITHSRNGSAVRTDTFTYSENLITEVRQLSTGERMTITTNLTTLETTVVYTAA